jgi:acetoin utilization deacetylase AcuC-like enzyme
MSAFPIAGLPWDNPGREGYDRPLLVWDGLGNERLPDAAKFLAAVRSVLSYKYPGKASAALRRRIARYLKTHKLVLRPPRYVDSRPARSRPATDTPVAVSFASGHAIHHVRERGFAERPVRVKAIREALADMPLEVVATKKFPYAELRRIHSPHYLKFMKDTVANIVDDEAVYPQIFPVRRPDKKPRELAMRLGYYYSDTFTPLSRSAYVAARSSFDTALTAAAQVRGGLRAAYAVCRPPGHHAERSLYGGFCYFNNAAGAAHHLSGAGKVAVLDIDYHHGNGTQDIFYERADVLTVSIHGHPSDHYPYFSGYEDEPGAGLGYGYNRNFAIRGVPGNDGYAKILKTALRQVDIFDPKYLVVALGLDIMKGDPTGNFGLNAAGMEMVGRQLRDTGRPLCIVQEGGYQLKNLRAGIRAFFTGLLASGVGPR